ncbi:hypothetical protein KZZ52_25455 [Dactylosporangium sp. AC04546]|uniref:hypothetical protein n=1 Tax=Dactylosporangium sp. AC04546 TaxID=2862460 RepID=UPI001EDD349C|nr:hypothetical protein [Dactylosporangium sp. AC04546]WVK88618.1 hypothetical protein KZZ52_25455 [Dactylosporangium sp. AC04546]
MQRIEVSAGGITVTLVTEPLVSMYGTVMRPGATSVSELPWDEVAGVALCAFELPPDGERRVTLTVDLTFGEFFEVHEEAEGFTDAVRELCRRSGLPVPDLTTTAEAVIFTPPGS